MIRRRLRLRLVLSYVGGLILGLFLFSAVAVLSIDRTLRSSLDARLESVTRATLAVITVQDGEPSIDASDRAQILDFLGVDLNGVVEDAHGRVILSNVSGPPRVLASASNEIARQVTLGQGQSAIRAQIAPITADGKRYGSVIVWRSSGWIDETDARIALAFAIVGGLIALLAVVAGNFVTKRALDDAFERQRRFTADASHELRAPLSVIVAESDLALAREARSPDEYAFSLRAIQEEARRMESLVDSLLWTARTEESQPHCVMSDVGEILAENRERLGAVVSAAGARLSLDVQGHVAAWLDGAAFLRALFAVVHNAGKFARERVEVCVWAGAQHADVAVLDDGPGFSRMGLLHATERFWREDRYRASSGNGLGLSIARSILEGSGGALLIANRREGGAMVTLRLRR
jgi:signal transduction histidine kinase